LKTSTGTDADGTDANRPLQSAPYRKTVAGWGLPNIPPLEQLREPEPSGKAPADPLAEEAF